MAPLHFHVVFVSEKFIANLFSFVHPGSYEPCTEFWEFSKELLGELLVPFHVNRIPISSPWYTYEFPSHAWNCSCY